MAAFAFYTKEEGTRPIIGNDNSALTSFSAHKCPRQDMYWPAVYATCAYIAEMLNLHVNGCKIQVLTRPGSQIVYASMSDRVRVMCHKRCGNVLTLTLVYGGGGRRRRLKTSE